MLDFIFIAIAAFMGGFIYRMRGGYGPSFPRPIEQTLFCLVFLLPLAALPWQWAWVPFVLAVIATLKGHGRNMDLGTVPVEDYPGGYEWFEMVTGWYKLHRKMPEYWYDVGGITISGLAVTLPVGVALAGFGHLGLGAFIVLLGAMKGLAYMVGWWLHPKGDNGPKTPLTKNATEYGEFLFGFFVWGGVLLAYV